MAALCARCNLKKGGKIVMTLREKTDQLVDRLKGRTHQYEFYDAASTIGRHGKTKFMLLVTPGGGKQADAYLAQMAIPATIADAFCWVTPRVNLRDQGERIPEFLAKACDELGLTRPGYRAADNVPDPRRSLKGYVTTIQSIVADPGMRLSEFKRARYCLILDEEQFFMDGGEWLRKLQPLIDAATVLIIMSGTLYRGDRLPVALAPYKRDVNGEEVLDKAHHDWITVDYSRADAIREGAILPLEFIRHDVRGRYVDGNGVSHTFEAFGPVAASPFGIIGEGEADKAKLDRDAQQEVRDQVRICVTGDVARTIIVDTLDRWRKARTVHPDCQCIIVVESQLSAKTCTDWVRKNYPGHLVGLAISDEKKDGRDAIKDFCAGHLDILITVGMAYIGMDAPRASHMALCCVIRSRPYIEQAVARLVRRHGKQARGVVVTFNDPLMLEVTRRIEQEQNEAVRRPQDGTERDGGAAPDRNSGPIHVSSETTGFHAHEPNRSHLLPEMTKLYSGIIEKHNLPLTPGQMHDLSNEMYDIEALPTMAGKAALPVGQKEQEDTFRQLIERKARTIDNQKGWPFGTTNRHILTRFKKPRPQMSLKELAQVVAWLNTFAREPAAWSDL